jgi:hypothetical protein
MCAKENVPVRKSALAGMVGKEERRWFSNRTEELANASRWGVRIKGSDRLTKS